MTNGSGQKQMRKAREQEVEEQLVRVLADQSVDFSDRATQGFTMLADKLTEDLESQLAHVEELKTSKDGGSFVDSEIKRLLRMLDKRRKLFEEIEEAIGKASVQSHAAKAP